MYGSVRERIDRAGEALLAMQRHSWEQGLAMQAFWETGNSDMAVKLAFEAVNRGLQDGRLACIGVQDAITDHCSVGEVLLAAIEKTGDEELIKAEKRLRSWALEKAPRSREGLLYHLLTGEEYWVDSMYMLPPYLGALGLFEEALKQFNGYWNALYDKSCGLLYHKWDNLNHFSNDPTHWGLGNGWAEMTVVRLYGQMEGKTGLKTEREELAEKGKNLINTVLSFRDKEGRLHNALDNEESYVEVAGMQMCAYSIYRAVLQGWLSKEYLADADDLREYAEENQDDYGFVHNVCGAPLFDKPGISPEQQAVFMMMEHSYDICRKDRRLMER